MKFRLFKAQLLAKRYLVCTWRRHLPGEAARYERSGCVTVFTGCKRCGKGETRHYYGDHPLRRELRA